MFHEDIAREDVRKEFLQELEPSIFHEFRESSDIQVVVKGIHGCSCANAREEFPVGERKKLVAYVSPGQPAAQFASHERCVRAGESHSFLPVQQGAYQSLPLGNVLNFVEKVDVRPAIYFTECAVEPLKIVERKLADPRILEIEVAEVPSSGCELAEQRTFPATPDSGDDVGVGRERSICARADRSMPASPDSCSACCERAISRRVSLRIICVY